MAPSLSTGRIAAPNRNPCSVLIYQHWHPRHSPRSSNSESTHQNLPNAWVSPLTHELLVCSCLGSLFFRPLPISERKHGLEGHCLTYLSMDLECHPWSDDP